MVPVLLAWARKKKCFVWFQKVVFLFSLSRGHSLPRYRLVGLVDVVAGGVCGFCRLPRGALSHHRKGGLGAHGNGGGHPHPAPHGEQRRRLHLLHRHHRRRLSAPVARRGGGHGLGRARSCRCRLLRHGRSHTVCTQGAVRSRCVRACVRACAKGSLIVCTCLCLFWVCLCCSPWPLRRTAAPPLFLSLPLSFSIFLPTMGRNLSPSLEESVWMHACIHVVFPRSSPCPKRKVRLHTSSPASTACSTTRVCVCVSAFACLRGCLLATCFFQREKRHTCTKSASLSSQAPSFIGLTPSQASGKARCSATWSPWARAACPSTRGTWVFA